MQFRDLHAQYEALKPEIDAGIQAVIESTGFILGKPVAELEEKLASYVGRKHCVGVANGTEALQLSLMAYDVGPGDGVCWLRENSHRSLLFRSICLACLPITRRSRQLPRNTG